MSSLFIDRAEYQETGWIDDLSKSPIIGQELLEDRISDKYEAEEPIKIGVIACMPKLEVYLNENGKPVYEYGPSKFKATVDYQARDLAEWRVNFEEQAGVAIQLECLVADTEARVKSDGLLFPSSKNVIGAKAKKVVSRIEKAFPENSRDRIKVGVRSEKFPVSDPIYRENFSRTFRDIYEEIASSKPETNPRIQGRMKPLLDLGIAYDYAFRRAIRDAALQDAEYAMEGLWIAYQSDWDAYLILEESPEVYAQRTCRLVGQGDLPIIFPNYEANK